MSSESQDIRILSELLTKAALEPGFRARLFSDPSRALSEYRLSENARATIERTIAEMCK